MRFYLSLKSWLAGEWKVASSSVESFFQAWKMVTVKGQREKAHLGKSLRISLFCWHSNDGWLQVGSVVRADPCASSYEECAGTITPYLVLLVIQTAATTCWQHGLCHRLHGLQGGGGETDMWCEQLSSRRLSEQKLGRRVCNYILGSVKGFLLMCALRS